MANFQVMLHEVTGSSPFQANNNSQHLFLERESLRTIWDSFVGVSRGDIYTFHKYKTNTLCRKEKQRREDFSFKALKSLSSYESLAVSHRGISTFYWKIFYLEFDFLKELPKLTNSYLTNTMLIFHIIPHKTSYTLEITGSLQRKTYIRNLT